MNTENPPRSAEEWRQKVVAAAERANRVLRKISHRHLPIIIAPPLTDPK